MTTSHILAGALLGFHAAQINIGDRQDYATQEEKMEHKQNCSDVRHSHLKLTMTAGFQSNQTVKSCRLIDTRRYQGLYLMQSLPRSAKSCYKFLTLLASSFFNLSSSLVSAISYTLINYELAGLNFELYKRSPAHEMDQTTRAESEVNADNSAEALYD